MCIQGVPSRPPHVPGGKQAPRDRRCALRCVSHRCSAAKSETKERLWIVEDAFDAWIVHGQRRSGQSRQQCGRCQETSGDSCNSRHGRCSVPRLSRCDGSTCHWSGLGACHESIHVHVGGVVDGASTAAHEGGAHHQSSYDASVWDMASLCRHRRAVQARPKQQQGTGRTMEPRQLHVRPRSSIHSRLFLFAFAIRALRTRFRAQAAASTRPCTCACLHLRTKHRHVLHVRPDASWHVWFCLVGFCGRARVQHVHVHARLFLFHDAQGKPRPSQAHLHVSRCEGSQGRRRRTRARTYVQPCVDVSMAVGATSTPCACVASLGGFATSSACFCTSPWLARSTGSASHSESRACDAWLSFHVGSAASAVVQRRRVPLIEPGAGASCCTQRRTRPSKVAGPLPPRPWSASARDARVAMPWPHGQAASPGRLLLPR
mmetsp:Transcript_11151/g.68672  ORF Transcript_11151/g.68672 Transcript_11151/m.68672 type:complete len:432 (-) Transcript_11151:194-1489(-)